MDPIYRSRPGADAMAPASAEQAEEVAPGIWCSPGLTNTYLLTTSACSAEAGAIASAPGRLR